MTCGGWKAPWGCLLHHDQLQFFIKKLTFINNYFPRRRCSPCTSGAQRPLSQRPPSQRPPLPTVQGTASERPHARHHQHQQRHAGNPNINDDIGRVDVAVNARRRKKTPQKAAQDIADLNPNVSLEDIMCECYFVDGDPNGEVDERTLWVSRGRVSQKKCD